MAIPPRSRGTVTARARTSYVAGRVLLPVQKFVHAETNSGIVLLAAAAVALVWVNSPQASSYESLWTREASLRAGGFVLSHSLRDWINDALMVMFFFVVGLEVKREFVHGELSQWRRASLPVVCALGGMVVPAALYAVFNAGAPTARGWGIPMATDIAFALGVLALAGDRVPAALRIFLLALATVDDVGAILVIAVFYSDTISFGPLVLALALVALIVVMRKLGVQKFLYYVPAGLLFWFVVLESGIHATLAGVILGFLTPVRPFMSKRTFLDAAEPLLGDVRNASETRSEAALGELGELTAATEAPADRLIRLLHPWSSFVVLPLFALANAGVPFTGKMFSEALGSGATRGVMAGLVLGKVIGIVLFAFLASRLRLATLMAGVRWSQLAGVGLLGGVGFTVSMFIADLAFTDAALVAQAKAGILVGSVVAGLGAFLVLRYAGGRRQSWQAAEPAP